MYTRAAWARQQTQPYRINRTNFRQFNHIPADAHLQRHTQTPHLSWSAFVFALLLASWRRVYPKTQNVMAMNSCLSRNSLLRGQRAPSKHVVGSSRTHAPYRAAVCKAAAKEESSDKVCDHRHYCVSIHRFGLDWWQLASMRMCQMCAAATAAGDVVRGMDRTVDACSIVATQAQL